MGDRALGIICAIYSLLSGVFHVLCFVLTPSNSSVQPPAGYQGGGGLGSISNIAMNGGMAVADLVGRIVLIGFSVVLMAVQIGAAITMASKPSSARPFCRAILVVGATFSLFNAQNGWGSSIFILDGIVGIILVVLISWRIIEVRNGQP